MGTTKVEIPNHLVGLVNLASLTSFQKKSKKMKKASKNEILVHGALLCELVTGKNHRLAIPQV